MSVGAAAGGVDTKEPVARRHHPIAVRGRRHGADRLSDIDDAIAPARRIELVHVPAHDVDEQQPLARGVPDRALAELEARVEHEVIPVGFPNPHRTA